MRSLVLLVACLACSFIESSANRLNVGHYKGGSITWKADENNPNNVIVFYRLNFRHHYQNGYLHEACTDRAIADRTILSTEGSFKVGGQWISWAKYICTDYDDAMDWSAGYYIMPYTLEPGTTRVDINFEECCWPTNVANNGNDQGSGRGWNMVSTIDISPRPDTGRPNTPPVAGTFPVYRLYRGCKYTRYIRAWDADGDNTRCRWTDPNRNECNVNNLDICGPLYVNSERTKRGAFLVEETCKITFNRRNPAGTYAVAVMVEDYAPSDPSTPLSRIPIQFLIEVHERDGECRKPVLLGEDGTCITIPVGRETRIPLRASSSSPQNAITSFETIKPSGVYVTPLSRVYGTDNEYSVTLSWVPTRDQIGRHVVCYEAEEDYRFSSDMFCIYVNVVDAAEIGPQLAVVPHESVPSPGNRLNGDTVTVTYSRQIQKAARPVFISILDASNNILFQVDSSSSDVIASGRSLTFSLPYDLPLERRSSYTIRVDGAAAKSTVDCEAAPQGDEWSFVFESFCDDGYSSLVVSPVESVPAPGTEMFGNVLSITYNKKIHKPETSAYVTIYDSRNSPVFRVDTSSDDVSISGKTLSFAVDSTVPLELRGRYRIRVDEGAVVSAKECEQGLPAMAEWDFVFITFCPDDSAYEPLTVLPSESVPSPGEQFAGQSMLIKYNKVIKKSTDAAYITIFDEFDLPIYQVDTSSPDVSVNGKTLSVALSVDFPLQFGGAYKILVGEGAVLSAQDCDIVLPPAAEWQFGFVTFCSDGQDYQPLSVLPMDSSPYPEEVFAGRVMNIAFNKLIRKPEAPAYISLFDSANSLLFQADSFSSDITVSGKSMTLSIPYDLPLQRGSSYTIRVDGAAAKSTMDCEAAPQGDEWSFVFESFCDDGYSPLVVSPVESVPAPGTEMFGNVLSITYNKKIQKPETSAYVTIYDSRNSPVFRVDTSSDDVSISGKALSFTVDSTIPLELRGIYRIRVDEGAVVSVNECEQGSSAMAEWDFVFITFCPDDSAYEPLTVLPSESVPSPGENFAGQIMLIKYNKEIKKSTDAAYITIFDEFDLPIYQVDTSSPDVSVNEKTLSVVLSVDLPLQFGGAYKILVGEGAVLSAQDCDLVLPPAADWQFGFVTFCSDGQDYQPLSVLPMDSSPYPEEVFAGRVMKIAYNKLIQKPGTPAYISLFDSANSLLFQIATTSPEVTVVDGTSISFTLPLDLSLEFQGVYKIRVDGWAAVSAQDCDVSRPDTAEWRFTFLTFCPDGGSDFERLAVLPLESHPRPGGNITGHDIIIRYNKPIQKPTSSALISFVTSDGSAIFAVDTTSDTVTIRDSSLAFSLPVAAAVLFGNDYRILVDAGAVRSVEECDVTLPASADWRFKYTGRLLPAQLNEVVSSQSMGNVDCRENFMQTFVPKRLVGDIDPSTMYLNEHSCTGRDYNQTHYVIGTSYDSCKTVSKVADKGRFTIFDNVVFIPPQPYTPGSEITREHFIEIHLSCHLPTDRVNFLSFDPDVTTIVYYEKGYGKFNFSLRMFQDQTYSRAYMARDYPVAVQQNQPMNFEGRVTCEDNCDLMFDTCWATPTSNPFDATRYPFITNGCPVDDTVQLLPSPSSRQERFAVNSFAFLGDYIPGLVYVHCDMRICDASDPNSRCSMGCGTTDQSSSESVSSDENIVLPVIPNRGDVPLHEMRRGKRDVSSAGSSSAAYPSTSGQLKLGKQKIDLESEQSQMSVNPDVVEIIMLGTILALLVVLVIMQYRRSSRTPRKASMPSV